MDTGRSSDDIAMIFSAKAFLPRYFMLTISEFPGEIKTREKKKNSGIIRFPYLFLVVIICTEFDKIKILAIILVVCHFILIIIQL